MVFSDLLSANTLYANEARDRVNWFFSFAILVCFSFVAEHAWIPLFDLHCLRINVGSILNRLCKAALARVIDASYNIVIHAVLRIT